MEEIPPADPPPITPGGGNSVLEGTQRRPSQNSNTAGGTRRPTRVHNRSRPVSYTPRDSESATPQIGGILALRSENMIKKVNYDQFCEKLYTYIMNTFKNGDSVVEVTKIPLQT